MASTHNTDQCYLVAADPSFRYPDSPQIREGFGAVVFQVDTTYAYVDDLIKLYHAECPDRPFDLMAIAKSELSPTEIVFANREYRKSRDAAACESLDPVYSIFGKCFEKLESLWRDFSWVIHELEEQSKREPTNSNDTKVEFQPARPAEDSPTDYKDSIIPRATFCLVAANERFRFAGIPSFLDGLGVFLYEMEARNEAETLANLFHMTHPERAFDLRVVAMRELTSTQFVLAERELFRTKNMAAGTPRDDTETPTDLLHTIEQCVKSLVHLTLEMKMSQDYLGLPWLSVTKTERDLLERFSPNRRPSQTISEAIEHLFYVLDRHRLVFLFVMDASRINPLLPASVDTALEQIVNSDQEGYADVVEDAEDSGTFLFRHRYFVEEYAEKALKHFGHGKGVKIEAEGGTYPFWQFKPVAGRFLQDSSELIIGAASEVLRLDKSKLLQQLANDAIEVAFDKGRSRWYSSVWTRWEYLEELESVIARAKRAVALNPKCDVEPKNDPSDDEDYYLRVRIVTDTYNWDPDVLGRVKTDPDYLPFTDEDRCFFKVSGKSNAERLVRLFEKAHKPEEYEGDERIRIDFSCHASSGYDEDDRFLFDEELKGIHARVLKGEVDTAYPLSLKCLYDRAQRWVESFQTKPATVTNGIDGSVENPAEDETKIEHEPASEGTLRAFLPTAIIGAMTLRDLYSICRFFPSAIPDDEASSLDKQLRNEIREAVKFCNLEDVLDSVRTTSEQEVDPVLMATSLMSILIMHHPDHGENDGSSDEIQTAMKRVIDVSVEKVFEPVRSLAERIQRAMIFDCRIPAPEGDESFREPQRFLQMLDTYWILLRSIVSLFIELPASLNPNPLADFINNLKSRIDSCFEVLADCDGSAESNEACATLVEIILSGDIDDLQVVPEWSRGELAKVDRFVTQTRLKLGAKSYLITAAEKIFVDVVQSAIREYESKVNAGWKKMLERAEGIGEKQNSAPVPPQESTPEDDELKPFTGGTMVFYEKSVVLCGVEICDNSPRLVNRRKALDLLRAIQEKDHISGISCEDMARELGIEESAVPGLISHTRNRIVDLLKKHAGILSKKEDVILTTEKHGYCLSRILNVELGSQQDQISQTEPSLGEDEDDIGSDVRNELHDVRKEAEANVRNVSRETRQKWILQQIDGGSELKAPAVKQRFKCSIKTAERDLKELVDANEIEYFGSKRSGYYRRPNQEE